jgi:hypothetical protein
VRAELEFDITDTIPIKDAALQVRAAKWLRVTAGRFRKPFSLISLTSSSGDLISRGHGNKLIAGTLGYGNRDLGLMVSGRAWRFRYYAGVFNGTGTLKEIDSGKDGVGRLTLRIVDEVQLGGSFSLKYRNPPGAEALLPDKVVVAAGGDIKATLGPVDVYAEGLWAQEREPTAQRDKLAMIVYAVLELGRLRPIVKVERVDHDLHGAGVTSFGVLAGANIQIFEFLRLMVQGEQILATQTSPVPEQRTLVWQLAFDEKLGIHF